MAESGVAAEGSSRRSERIWLAVTLLFGLFYGVLALRLAFAEPLTVQDDARQHVFWMRRFMDPGLFPNDLIANYFQSVAPEGYKAVYWLLAKAGLDPLVANKLLPPVIGLVCAYLAFRVFMELLPDPRGAFVASLLLNQMLWMKDDVMSATPRGFVYPLFLAFLLFLLRRQLIPCLLAIGLQGVFYPQSVFVSAGLLILRMIRREEGKFRLSRERTDLVFCIAGLATAGAVLLPFALSSSHYGPVVSAQMARSRPEFWETGRSRFFLTDFRFWYNADRSGLFPRAIFSPFMWTGFLLPFLMLRKGRGPVLDRAVDGSALLLRLVITSVGLWALAHLLLFKLHLPSRYSHWVLRIVFAMSGGIVLTAGWEALRGKVRALTDAGKTTPSRVLAGVGGLMAVLLVAWAHFSKGFPDNSYKEAPEPRLYAFLRTQPKDSLVASLGVGADFIPTFARLPILVGKEYAIPYHLGYYNQVRQRGQDLLRAQYSKDPAEVRAFIRKYGVKLWIVERNAFTREYLNRRSWFRQVTPNFKELAAGLNEGAPPVLEGLVDRCKIWENDKSAVLSAALIEEALEPTSTRMTATQ